MDVIIDVDLVERLSQLKFIWYGSLVARFSLSVTYNCFFVGLEHSMLTATWKM